MSIPANFVQARFTPQSGGRTTPVSVHFNPASLQYTVANTMKDPGSGNKKKQYVSQSTGKLTMDVIFDTTHTGEDVRTYTEKVARFMEPDEKKIPPVILFEWGLYKFQGMMESYKETVDFFAANGVPLRATVNLTLAQQDKVFEPSDTSRSANTQQNLALDAVELPSGTNRDATTTAASGGDPRAGRGIAAANGLESMRFTAGAALTVGAAVRLGPPVAFASGGGLGLSASGGLGLSASGGIGLSTGGGMGLGISGTAGVTGGVSTGASFGASASAGITASAGAFAGLRSSEAEVRVTATLDTSRLLPRSEAPSLATDSGASFHVGGQARVEASASMRADVGATASLRTRIQFEE